MKKQLAKLALTATLGLAITFTLNACGGGDVSTVKKGKLKSCPDFTIEEMFDALLEKPKWQRITENDNNYVTVSGVTAGSDKPQNVLAKFWVSNDDSGTQIFEIDSKSIIEAACNSAEVKAIEKVVVIQAEPIKDSRDDKTYKTVKIGEQTWMAENLNIETGKSKCYKNNPANCQKYGRLYDWKTAMKACPSGWHLPSRAEWEVLITLLGGKERAGKYLKTANDWSDDDEEKSGNGTDNYGFSALPSGTGSSGGSFYSIGRYGYWWSSSEGSASEYSLNNAYIRYMGYGNYVFYSKGDKNDLYSVRCLQNASEPPKAETPTATESDSEGSGEDACPNREGPPITIEAVTFLESPEDHEGRDMALFRLANGKEIVINGTPDDVKKGDKGSITYSEEQLPFDTDCWQLDRLISWKKTGVSANTLTDARDKQTYWTAKIGKQVWMAENLNIEMGKSVCYNDDEEYCKNYGRLYDWETAMKACPSGWHLPSNEEWDKLYHYVDGTSGSESPYESITAWKHLKAKSGWDSNGNGTDKFGFSALPSGRGYSDGSFGEVILSGFWWTASEYESYAYYRYMYYDNKYADWDPFQDKSYLYSVRCIKD